MSSNSRNSKVSVITPLFNAARHIPAFIRLIDRQTISPYEVIFIDDGSTDATWELLQTIGSLRYCVKRLRHSVNRNQGTARNTGLAAATGTHIMFIDVDDSFESEYIGHLIETVERDSADIAFCNSIWKYPDHDDWRDAFLSSPGTSYRLLTGRKALDNYFNVFQSDFRVPTEPWGKIIRKSFLDNNKLCVPPVLFEDVIMNFQELALANKVAFTRRYLYHYDKNNLHAVTKSRKAKYLQELYRVPEQLNLFLANRGLKEMYAGHVLRLYFCFFQGAYEFFVNGENELIEEFEEAIDKYLQYSPSSDLEPHVDYVISQMRSFLANMQHRGMHRQARRFLHSFDDFIVERGASSESDPGIGQPLPSPSLLEKIAGKLFPVHYQISVLRRSGMVDPVYYSNHYRINPANAVEHYVRRGWREGNNPSVWFDGRRYLDLNPDIRTIKVNPLVHYVLHGQREGRKI